LPRPTRAALAFAATTSILAPVAYLATFSGFPPFDDEGYFVIALRDFVAGPNAFSHVPALYGPLYYELVGGFFKLTGLAVTHDNGRYLTVAIWLAASVLQGLAAYRLTNRLWLGVCAQLVGFHVLAAMAPEPLHPSGLVGLLIGGIALAATLDETRPRLSGTMIGGLCAALCLIKVNSGLFAVLALALAWSAARPGFSRRWMYPSLGALVAVLPAQLMWDLIGTAWVLQFAILVTTSIVVLYLAGLPDFVGGGRRPALVWLAIGGAAVAAMGLALMYPSGWSLQDLLAGLRQAGRLPQAFVWPMRINWLYAGWSVLVLVALIGGRLWLRVGAPLVVGAATWLLLLLLPAALFLFALPLTWLVILRDTEFESVRFARLLLAWLAVMETLQAYPIAGMQLSLAALGLVPLGALMLSDGLQDRASSATRWRWLAPAVTAFCGALLAVNAYIAAADYDSGVPSGLSGMNAARLPVAQADALLSTTRKVEDDCSSFITYPGLYSFYPWSGQQPPPVAFHAGPWMFLVDAATQRSMVDELRTSSNLCVIEDRAMVDFWAQGRSVPDRPLVRYIESDFTVIATFGDYTVLARTPSIQ
jgi:hypothetical protein